MRSETRRLDEDLDPVALGAATGMLWSRQGFAMAGVGEAMRIPLERSGGAGALRAQQEMRDLAGVDGVGLPGTGPVAFAAMPFDPSTPAELVVPEVVVARGRDGRRWATTVGEQDQSWSDGLDRCVAIMESPRSGPEPQCVTVSAPVDPAAWRDHVVASARERIRLGELTKVVLARELLVAADVPFDTTRVIERLVQAHRSAIIFALDGFVGASPELLVSRAHDVVRAHPLAGTAARISDPALDQQSAAGLLASAKDRSEHQITIDWLLDELLPFCSYVDAEPEPTIVSLANVHHLGTQVEGRLSSPPSSVLELVAALHPTPAVGGDPQLTALALIDELEPAGRGRYAGPTGWVDAAGNGSFCVAIRSAEIDGRSARLFAGVGVVADSEPEAELAETRAKFQAMLPTMLQL